MTRWLPLLAFLLSCGPGRVAMPANAPTTVAAWPKNIILLIGDGMALSQVSAGLYWTGVGKSAFEQFPYVGFHKSHSHNDLITDSAAGATAFACGVKTTNGAIGVLPPDNHPCQTILELLDGRGWATGMVVTCSATHATPASFIAHQDLRAFTDEIAIDYLKTPLDCFVGGGGAAFNQRLDRRNLVDSLEQRGYTVRTGTSFKKLPMDGAGPFFLFTADREPPTALAGRTYLADATRQVAEYLTRRGTRGFFLVVEGSQIDWALHANDRRWLRSELLDFDGTLRAALEFARTNGETLVVVTGDHECGGLSLPDTRNRREFAPTFSSRLHTGTLVPVFAFGPQAELFTGVYENTALYDKMLAALGRTLAEGYK